jgi:glutaconate CoA-transferase subunit B
VFVVPKVILFRTEHSKRTLVPKVSFISAPGGSDYNVQRSGGPIALITNRCLSQPTGRRASSAAPRP